MCGRSDQVHYLLFSVASSEDDRAGTIALNGLSARCCCSFFV